MGKTERGRGVVGWSVFFFFPTFPLFTSLCVFSDDDADLKTRESIPIHLAGQGAETRSARRQARQRFVWRSRSSAPACREGRRIWSRLASVTRFCCSVVPHACGVVGVAGGDKEEKAANTFCVRAHTLVRFARCVARVGSRPSLLPPLSAQHGARLLARQPAGAGQGEQGQTRAAATRAASLFAPPPFSPPTPAAPPLPPPRPPRHPRQRREGGGVSAARAREEGEGGRPASARRRAREWRGPRRAPPLPDGRPRPALALAPSPFCDQRSR